MKTFELIAKTFQGLEEILAKELTELGADDIQIGRRMVSFTGDKMMMYRANFHLRTAIRILKPILHFNAKDADEKLALIEGELMDACQIICDIYSRYLFETSVIENRPNEFMNADRLCELMTEAQKRAYGDGLDESVMHPFMWLCKGHYYSGSLSFYNFPYAFGGLFARGLYAKYQKEGESFVATYKEMLRQTALSDVEECARVAGIDLTRREFWCEGLATIAEKIDEFCRLVEA